MMVSGLSLFAEAAGQVVAANTIAVTYTPLSNKLTTQLQWQQFFALEFEYGGGFEFERSIPISELPDDKQTLAEKLGQVADRLVVVSVFGADEHAYELYAHHNGTVHKFDMVDSG